eukprot:GFKZ01002221.1.p1 GENE.GFKZ01002221.1~~GFKZ01002221.1.p1  ORF type:complete len:228 (-),score=11.34 GFKZ01002221.1:159-842(-)
MVSRNMDLFPLTASLASLRMSHDARPAAFSVAMRNNSFVSRLPKNYLYKTPHCFIELSQEALPVPVRSYVPIIPTSSSFIPIYGIGAPFQILTSLFVDSRNSLTSTLLSPWIVALWAISPLASPTKSSPQSGLGSTLKLPVLKLPPELVPEFYFTQSLTVVESFVCEKSRNFPILAQLNRSAISLRHTTTQSPAILKDCLPLLMLTSMAGFLLVRALQPPSHPLSHR